jgi:regulator of protease activity HflC (stomatin/prohibitin superfamily)
MIIAGREVNTSRSVTVLLALLALVTLGLSVFTVKEYERDVVTRLGKFSRVAEPGLNFKIPFVESAFTYRTDILSFTTDKPVNTYTVDNQEVDVIFTVFYRVPTKNVQFIYTNAQDY